MSSERFIYRKTVSFARNETRWSTAGDQKRALLLINSVHLVPDSRSVHAAPLCWRAPTGRCAVHPNAGQTYIRMLRHRPVLGRRVLATAAVRRLGGGCVCQSPAHPHAHSPTCLSPSPPPPCTLTGSHARRQRGIFQQLTSQEGADDCLLGLCRTWLHTMLLCTQHRAHVPSHADALLDVPGASQTASLLGLL